MLWFILAVGFGVRLLGAWNGTLKYDESTHLTCAETIDLRPQYFHLVFRSVDHPLLSVYVLRLSGYLFGDSNFGLRILHVLFGTLTLIPIFFLGKKVFSEEAGLWAAALLAVDQFHQIWSYFAVEEILLLFFATLVLLQFLRAMESKTRGDFLTLGVLLGFAYLAKETAIILIAVLWLCVLIDPKLRPMIRNPLWYLAQGVALLIALPDILWNFFNYYEGFFYRDVGLMSETVGISSRALRLYLGEITHDLTGGPHTPSVSHWPAGLLYLGASIGAWPLRRDWRVQVLMIVFLSFFLFFTFVPARASNAWWWGSISLLPAVIFAGNAMDRFAAGAWSRDATGVWGRLPEVMAVMFVCYLGLNAVFTGLKTGIGAPRRSAAQLVKEVLADAQRASTSKEMFALDWRLMHTLHITGPNPDLYAYLARVAYERKQIKRAEYFVHRSLALDASNQLAFATARLIGATKTTVR